MKSKIVLVLFISAASFSCSTIKKEKQSEKTKLSSSVKSQSDSSSTLRDKSQTLSEVKEHTGTWTFEEWYRSDVDADTVIRPAYFPPGYPHHSNQSTNNKKGWNYRKSTFINSDKSSKVADNKDILLDKAASNSLDAKADSLGKSDNKQVITTPDYGWILPCIGIGVLIGFVAYIWYRKTRPVAKIIQMVPGNYKDV